MTVKCLNELQKSVIGNEFLYHNVSIEELANQYARSRRTIVRVLEEQDIDPGIRRRNRKSKADQLAMYQNLDLTTAPKPSVIPTKTPWYRRILDKVIRPFH